MIYSIGEILVDIFNDNGTITKKPGGAAFNVACNIKAYGGKVGFYGSIGEDESGDFLYSFAKSRELDSCVIRVNKEFHTTEAIVSLDNGERDFKFNRDNGADYQLSINQALEAIDFDQISIVHFGSLMLSEKNGKDFLTKMIHLIKANNKALISFDANYRNDIFDGGEETIASFVNVIKNADIIKFTKEELKFLSEESGLLNGLKKLVSCHQIAFVTLGKEGSIFYRNGKIIKVD